MPRRALKLTSFALVVVSPIVFGSAGAQANDGRSASGDPIAPFSSDVIDILYKLTDALVNPIDHAGEALTDHLYPRFGQILGTLEHR
jgi:hypothetical protein